MIKLNNKGFALAETLITAVFVMVIFSVIYTNYTPIMAEYERRETYDDLDGKYAAYWMRRLIEECHDPTANNNLKPDPNDDNKKYIQIRFVNTNGNYVFTNLDVQNDDGSHPTVTDIEIDKDKIDTYPLEACNNNFEKYKETCKELVLDLQITAIYITPYSFRTSEGGSIKGNIYGNNANLEDYLKYLPEYNVPKNSNRVIVEMVRKNNKEVEESNSDSFTNEVFAYSTIGVDMS